MVKRILLGPQRPVVNLGDAIASGGLPDGPIAVVSAGWQEAEGDLAHASESVQRHLADLRLYQRAEEIFAAVPELRALYRERQDRLKAQQRLYVGRLRQLMIAARGVLRAEGEPQMLAAEQRHAVIQLRALDRHHLKRVRAIHDQYDAALEGPVAELVEAHAEAIRQNLAQCETVMITGGNVLVLLNRLRLFGVDKMLADKHIVAWSAGAMALSNVIVLFHDKMAQGQRNAEIMDSGTGLLPGYVFLPDAAHRLKARDRVRVRLFSRRFSPLVGVTLDNGALVEFDGVECTRADGVRRLSRNGKLKKLRQS